MWTKGQHNFKHLVGSLKSVITVKYLVFTISGQIKIILGCGKSLFFGQGSESGQGVESTSENLNLKFKFGKCHSESRDDVVVGVTGSFHLGYTLWFCKFPWDKALILLSRLGHQWGCSIPCEWWQAPMPGWAEAQLFCSSETCPADD